MMFEILYTGIQHSWAKHNRSLKKYCKNLLALAFTASVIKQPLKMGLGS
jgi:hypothetical protein